MVAWQKAGSNQLLYSASCLIATLPNPFLADPVATNLFFKFYFQLGQHSMPFPPPPSHCINSKSFQNKHHKWLTFETEHPASQGSLHTPTLTADKEALFALPYLNLPLDSGSASVPIQLLLNNPDDENAQHQNQFHLLPTFHSHQCSTKSIDYPASQVNHDVLETQPNRRLGQ